MKKTLTVLLALVLVIAMSVAGTMAYLTSEDKVENSFTVGKVAITLDEAKVNEYGQKLNASGTVAGPSDTLAERVDENTYKLIPGHEYVKDPVIHFQPKSEASWLFVKVENGIKDIVAATTIETQITSAPNSWIPLDGYQNVYYKSVDANKSETAAVDYPVFGSFKLTSDAAVATYENAKIVVTAYAVQADGFTSATDAWINTFGAPSTT